MLLQPSFFPGETGVFLLHPTGEAHRQERFAEAWAATVAPAEAEVECRSFQTHAEAAVFLVSFFVSFSFFFGDFLGCSLKFGHGIFDFFFVENF